ncbi:MAG TPA: hypothetical protein VJU83_03850 [Burkholderiales bacterium]|nr:hypothetical protein [Burkholderiales bacterium]
MQGMSWGLTFAVMYAPMVLGAIFTIAAAILFHKVRSTSTAILLIGALVVTLMPWAYMFFFGTVHPRDGLSTKLLIHTAALLAQTFGFLFYVLSVQRRAQN